MATQVYNRAKLLLGQALLDFGASGSDLRVMLVTSAYTHNLDHDFVSDANAAELSGGNYVRKTLASKTWTLDDAGDQATFDAADATWSALLPGAGTPTMAIVFKFVTSDADSPLVAAHDLSPVTAPNGGDYTVAWDAAGILSLVVAP